MNLIFTLDGLAAPKKNWKGWKHRIYIAVLVCDEKIEKFKHSLKNYDYLYSEVRNQLVHEGGDFYELPCEPKKSTQDIFLYIKKIIILIEEKGFKTVVDLRSYAISILSNPDYISAYEWVIYEVNSRKGKPIERCSWLNELNG